MDKKLLERLMLVADNLHDIKDELFSIRDAPILNIQITLACELEVLDAIIELLQMETEHEETNHDNA